MVTRPRIVTAAALLLTLAGGAALSAQDFPSLKGTLAVGGTADVLNATGGPAVEYWLTDQLGIGADVHLVGDFDIIDATAQFLVPADFRLFDVPTRPYLGAGFRKVEEDVRVRGSAVSFDGDGLLLFAGLRQATALGRGVLSWGVEVTYSAFDVEVEFLGFDAGQTDYEDVSLGARLFYHF